MSNSPGADCKSLFGHTLLNYLELLMLAVCLLAVGDSDIGVTTLQTIR